MPRLVLFPPYLNAGSTGTAVAHLQGMICSMRIGANVTRNGLYDPDMVAAVKEFQIFLGLSGADVDGHFGPVTRKAIRDEYDIDVDIIPYSPKFDSANHWRSPNFEGIRGWKGGNKKDLEGLKKDKK